MIRKKIAVLTGGGDSPGLNACISAIVKYGWKNNMDIYGFRDGWKGVLDKDLIPLTPPSQTEELLLRGGTILGASRTNPRDQILTLLKNLKTLKIDSLITLGGDGTSKISLELIKRKFPVIGLPKTIDNDLSGTDYCIGFDSAVEKATSLLDSLHSTARSHSRTFVIEVMGRHTGWIAIKAGIASGAHAIIIPEFPILPIELYQTVRNRYRQGTNWTLVVVAEGAIFDGVHYPSKRRDASGNLRSGGIGQVVADKISRNTGIETRFINLGHLLRAGTPSAYDRLQAVRLGIKAIDCIKKGQTGKMIGVKGSSLVMISFRTAIKRKRVPRSLYDLARKMS